MHRRYSWCFVVAIAFATACTPTGGQAADITAELVVQGLAEPVGVTAPRGDYSRLFVLEQHTGNIKIVRGNVVSGVFLTVGPLSMGGEQGLLGLAFHPDYAANGKFYVSYTTTGGMSVLSEFRVSSDPDVADPHSERVLLTQPQPYSNHNGGNVLFGRDGYLYFGFGDGGSGGDPENRAQNDATWLGKLLRIDVNSQDPDRAYHIPSSNPFAGPGDPLDEIWAKGLRNPWRFSFDRQTGDLYIADVGQGAYEEVDFQTAASTGGENYGWRLMEGRHCYLPSTGCSEGVNLVEPVLEYAHNGSINDDGCPSGPNGCSITGGFVYRGQQIPEIQGRYFFADYCSNRVHSFRVVSGAATECQENTAALASETAFGSITSFGEDAAGELYFVGSPNGSLFKIVRTPALPVAGDMDGDGDVDVQDLMALIQRATGPAIACTPDCGGADLDGDADVDQTDFGLFQRCLSGANRPVPPDCV